ncbi:MAG: PAS domain S-box protein [Candidatus Methylomirabilales bacterium]
MNEPHTKIPERGQTDEALQQAHRALQTLIHASPVGIIALDREGHIKTWNAAAEHMFGWSAHEVLDRPPPFVPEDKQGEFRALHARVLRGEAFTGLELHRQRKDGSPIDVSLSTAPLRDAKDDIIGIMAVVADITERKRAEQQLGLQSTALESAANAILITDREGHISWVNPAFTHLTGYTAEEVLGQTPRLLRSGIHAQSFYTHLWETIRSGKVWHGEIINRRKDGSLYTEEQTITPVRDERGEISHFIAIKRDVTARKRMEEALRESEERYRTLFENAPVGLGVADAEGNLLTFNTAMLEPGGYTREDIARIGNVAQLYADPGERARVLETAKRQGFLHQQEVRFMRKDGSYYTALLSLTPITTEGRPGWQAMVQDITERKRVEAELEARARELAIKTERLEVLGTLSRTMSATLDPRQALDFVVEAAVHLLNATAARLWLWDESAGELHLAARMGDPDLTPYPVQAFQRGESIVGRAFHHREALVSESPATDSRYAGQQWARENGIRAVVAVPVLIGDRTFGALAVARRTPGVFQDEELALLRSFASQAAIALENARLFEENLRAKNELTTLLEINTKIGTAEASELLQTITDEAVRLLEADGAGFRLLEGRSLVVAATSGVAGDVMLRPRLSIGESLSGQAVAENRPLFLPDTAALSSWAKEHQTAAIRHGVKSIMIIPVRIADRVIGVLNTLTKANRQFTQRHVNLAMAFADQAAISVNKARLYREVAAQKQHLEERVRDRTQELRVANIRLQEALQRAEEASRTKSRFLATMSHELRTPLNAIIGFSELLEDQQYGSLNPRQQRYVSHVLASGRHLLMLITDILDLTKIEAGRLTVEPLPFPLPEALHGALESLRPQAETKGIDLQLTVDACPATLVADPVRFNQILYNLLSNAVKFTPSGGTVRVSARPVHGSPSRVHSEAVSGCEPSTMNHERGGDFVEIDVCDTGIGIKAEDMPKLFQEFTQLDASLARRHQGTGLGLVLTKKMVEMHGGTIEVHSPGEGLGSTFTVTLPLDGPSATPPTR